MESLILLNKNRYETIKDRMCSIGSTQQEYIFCKEATILIAALEDIIAPEVNNAKHKRGVIMLDIPNVLLQIEIALDSDKINMNTIGQLVNIYFETFPGVYSNMSGMKEDRRVSTYRYCN